MSWPLVKLSDCCEVVGGATPKREVPEYWDSPDVPWITPKDVSDLACPTLEDAPEYISEAGFKSCSTSMLPKGSVLVTSRAPIGNIAIAGRDLCTNQGFKSLIPSESVDGLYLYYCMKHSSQRLQALGNGATFKEVSKKIVEEFEIPLPPLSEQKRIASILDKADAIRRKRQQAIQLADDFLRAVFLDMFGDPVTNPKGWEVKPLGSFCSFQGGFAFKSSDYADSGVPLVKISNVHFENVEWEDISYVAEGFLASRSDFSLKTGDLVMAMTRPIIKSLNAVKLVEIKERDIPALLNQRVGRFRRYEDVVARGFLKYFLYSDYFKSEVEKLCSVALQPNVSSNQIESIYCYLPPRSIQEQFSRIVSSVSVFEPKLKVAAIENLVTALSQKAFAGQL